MSDRETLAADMQQAFHHWSTKRGEVFEVMADIALSAIADETQRLRAELAAEKERANTAQESCTHWANDYAELQAKLAAETQAGKVMAREYTNIRVKEETERCAKIVESELPQFSWEPEHAVLTAIAAAIRASNAAPRVGKIAPKEAILAQLDDKVDWALNYLKGVLSALPNDFGAKNAIEAIELLIEQNEEYAEELGTLRSNAAPPHVEPADYTSPRVGSGKVGPVLIPTGTRGGWVQGHDQSGEEFEVPDYCWLKLPLHVEGGE